MMSSNGRPAGSAPGPVSDRWIGRLFYLLGGISFLAGVFIILYSAFSLRPRLDRLMDQVNSSLAKANQASDVIASNQILLDATSRFSDAVPEALVSLKGTLAQLSQALSEGGHVAKKSTQGITGLVTPNQQLRATNVYLQRSAEQLNLLVGMIDQMAQASSAIKTELPRFRSELGAAGVTLQAVREQVSDTQNRLDAADLPVQAMLLGFGLGGIFLMQGGISLILGLAYGRLMNIISVGSPPIEVWREVA